MRVDEIMTNATITDSTSGTLRSAAEQMWRQQTGSVVIVEGDEIVGIITERDVMRAVGRGADPDEAPITEVMTREVITAEPGTHVREAARLMAQHWIRHLPIVDNGKLAGILSQRDVIGVFAALWYETGAPEIDVDNLVRQRRLARVEAGDLD
ncbi:cyclic nucleotide-binding/CBS domain-containing protein [Jiangella sp. DSM 45060]|uniref:CBS domain-containing protein n=1 Tax=Jiangella sp. DSM 45060 TaxID=1798224 RepID=UPI00087B398E|nr:CBS domain-containing protein [Jiangella sp. DSM 45060]SDT61625.1 CBS domain-containing protein [Jiangella sp. DSM 45060]